MAEQPVWISEDARPSRHSSLAGALKKVYASMSPFVAISCFLK
jgi:hypothetical protein